MLFILQSIQLRIDYFWNRLVSKVRTRKGLPRLQGVNTNEKMAITPGQGGKNGFIFKALDLGSRDQNSIFHCDINVLCDFRQAS